MPKKKPAKRGRPRSNGPLTERFMVCCTPEQKTLWTEIAKHRGASLSRFANAVMASEYPVPPVQGVK